MDITNYDNILKKQDEILKRFIENNLVEEKHDLENLSFKDFWKEKNYKIVFCLHMLCVSLVLFQILLIFISEVNFFGAFSCGLNSILTGLMLKVIKKNIIFQWKQDAYLKEQIESILERQAILYGMIKRTQD